MVRKLANKRRAMQYDLRVGFIPIYRFASRLPAKKVGF